jgi:hypothetical protein
MTQCLQEVIETKGGNHAAAALETSTLTECAQSRIGADSTWLCNDTGCWQDGSGFNWLRILSAIENPQGQLPGNTSGEADYVSWCQEALGLGAEECRSIWRNTGS